MKVCLILGPYRNLTTMTCSYVNFHENIIVFNHGLQKIKNQNGDFWNKQTLESFNRFTSFVKKNYLGGSRGDKGGSIALSHGYDKKHILSEHRDKIPQKSNVAFIFLKESGRVTKELRSNFSDFTKIDKLISVCNGRVVFIRPVRTIYKSVLSNIETRRVSGRRGLYDYHKRSNHEKNFLEWYLSDLNWFCKCKSKYPDLFLCFYEKDIQRLNEIICNFLDIPLSRNMISEIKVTDTSRAATINRWRSISLEQKQKQIAIMDKMLVHNKLDKLLYTEIREKDLNMPV